MFICESDNISASEGWVSVLLLLSLNSSIYSGTYLIIHVVDYNFFCRYGTFFGPSKPVLARRVIEEGCSSFMKERENVSSRVRANTT